MSDHIKARASGPKKVAILGFGSFAVAATFMGLSSAAANAEITEVAPEPVVTSRQATLIDEDAVRPEGTTGEIRVSDVTVVRGGVDERDSVKAVPGSTASPFEGAWPTSPTIGDF